MQTERLFKSIFNFACVTAISSGFVIGGSNWIIQTKTEKIVFLSEMIEEATRHPQPIDKVSLSGADAVIVSKMSCQIKVKSREETVAEICKHISSTVAQGGNVVLPSFSFGNIYELIDEVRQSLVKQGLPHIPISFFSPVANFSLQYSNILSEWLQEWRRERAYLPEEPFVHTMLAEKSSLILSASSAECKRWREPCVVFAGHPSLRLGDVQELLRLWGGSQKHLLLFTEPMFRDADKLLAPFHLRMRALCVPFDPPFDCFQVSSLLESFTPKHVLFPSCLFDTFSMHMEELKENSILPKCIPIRCNESLSLPILKRRFEEGVISAQLASSLLPAQYSSVRFSEFSAILSVRDNQFTLSLPHTGEPLLKKTKSMWGPLNKEKLLSAIKKASTLRIEFLTFLI